MAPTTQYPYTYHEWLQIKANREEFRDYYSPSLTDPRDVTTSYTIRQQDPFYKSNAIPVSVGIASLAAAGFVPVGNKRIWDYYIKGARTIEEYSPGTIFRTFQISTILSQFGSTSTIDKNLLSLSAEKLQQNRSYANYLTKLISGDKDPATTYAKLVNQGVELRGGQLFFGGGDLALQKASLIHAPAKAGMQFGLGYAASVGEVLNKSNLPANDDIASMIIGGKSRLQHVSRQLTGLGTAYVGRFNELLSNPFELEPFKSIFGKIEPIIQQMFPYKLGVKPGSGLEMMGRFGMKYGAGLGALYMGYQAVDYMMRQSDILDDTLFGEGLTVGIATLGIQANLALATAAEATGLQSYREAQEEIAPGSTSLQKLMAVPLVGGMGALIAGYGAKVYRMAQTQIKDPAISSTQARRLVEEAAEEFRGDSVYAKIGRALTHESGELYNRQDILGRILRKVATPEGGKLSFKFVGQVGPVKLAGLAGMAAGAALTLPFLPGALIPDQSPEELKRIYSGEEEVAVRKGRWWEFGRSPYEGSRIMYYRPHWYPRMRMRAKEKAIYGEEELNPLEKFWKREFTYELEQEHYQDRPYPITALPFEDVPLIGPLLAATVGRLIKPERLMHTEEWLTEQGIKTQPPRFGGRLATEVGEQPHAIPTSPYTPTQIIGEQAYRMTEMIGLPGFIMTSIKESITGTPELFDQVRQLESARRMAGYEREYWDLELGGMLGMNEAFRRLYPHRRRQIPLYNPIRNTMPEWLPGSGERSPDFLHGDPYTKVAEGELRLPGRGYEARFPELKGTAAEDYPLIHQYRILADIAPYSEKFKEIQGQIRGLRKTKSWGEYEENIYQTVKAQRSEQRNRKEFNEYQYLNTTGGFGKQQKYATQDSASLLAALNEMYASKQEEQGLWSRIFGGYWEALSHNTETVVDQLTPMAPGAKLMHQRTAIEDYERTNLFGSENAFWNRPWRDFLRPTIQTAAASFGFTNVPEHLQQKRQIEQYFDILKYAKYARLANVARASRDFESVAEFEAKKDETLFGINPFTRNYTSLYRALPRSERDYFAAFEKATSTEQRAKILEMVPENEKALYLARWKLQMADDIRKAKKEGILTEEQTEEANDAIWSLYRESKKEGFPTSKELFAEYVATRSFAETYADWYRRTKILSKMSLPGADWVGWHPSVDLQDIKLKFIQELGEDMHEYNLWASQAQGLIDKPYIDDAAISELVRPKEMSDEQLASNINELLLINESRPSVFFEKSWNMRNNEMTISIEQEPDLESMLKEIL